jgi:hypothetical protein
LGGALFGCLILAYFMLVLFFRRPTQATGPSCPHGILVWRSCRACAEAVDWSKVKLPVGGTAVVPPRPKPPYRFSTVPDSANGDALYSASDIYIGTTGAYVMSQKSVAPQEFRVYFPRGDCGAYRQEPNGEVCFVWNGVKVEWQEFLGRVHELIDAAQTLDAYLPHGYGEKLVTHYDPEVERLHKVLLKLGLQCGACQ